MTWTWDGTVLPSIDEPDEDSVYPLHQARRVVKHHPIGLSSTNATIITDLGAPSVEATMRFRCTDAMRVILEALELTTFAVIDPWGVTRNWYLERNDIARMPTGRPATDTPFFDITTFLVER